MTGEHPGWRQGWRGPLREALDWLRDEIAPKFENRAPKLLTDPWGARDAYISIICDRSSDNIEQFLRTHATGGLTVSERAEVLMLLEMQRHLLLMFTSCGWFFEDVAGIETVQDLQYAGRAIQLAEKLFGDNLESDFITHLEKAAGNRFDLPNGKVVYEKMVQPDIVDQLKLCAHYALTGLFEDQPEKVSIYQHEVQRVTGRSFETGRSKLTLGRVQVRSRVTCYSSELCYAAVHFGDHNISCGVRHWDGDEAYQKTYMAISTAFNRADITAIVRLLDQHFAGQIYALNSLFKDGQRKLLKRILKQTLNEAEGLYREILEDHMPLMRFLGDIGSPVPKAFTTAAEFILNGDIKRAVKGDELDVMRITEWLEEAATWKIDLDLDGLAYAMTRTADRLAEDFEARPREEGTLARLWKAVKLADDTILDINLWTAQNACYTVSKSVAGELKERKMNGYSLTPDEDLWLREFQDLAQMLKVAV